MRLFFAINFSEQVKHQIYEVIESLRPYAQKGRFVKKANLHLTLEFLGEIDAEEVDSLKEILKGLNGESFALNLTELGFFNTRRGRIYWLGLQKNKALMELQAGLHEQLLANGFEVGDRPYHPHITLGRELKFQPDFKPEKWTGAIQEIAIEVAQIDLMESKFTNNQLVYSVVASKRLKKP